MISDDTDIEYDYRVNLNNYQQKYYLLLERCQALQEENEKLVYRIQQVKKLLQQRKKEVLFLERKLDVFEDNWRKNDIEVDDKIEIKIIAPTISAQTTTVKTDKAKPEPEKPKVLKKHKRKLTKNEKTEKDPHAPKRPANPFFQFCQEQRQILMEHIIAKLKPGELEPTKQELTRQLAYKWKTLSVDDKRVYIDMYERSKEKYVEEMSAYNCKN